MKTLKIFSMKVFYVLMSAILLGANILSCTLSKNTDTKTDIKTGTKTENDSDNKLSESDFQGSFPVPTIPSQNANANSKGPINNKRPNVMIILADDLGYSDVGCYGGVIETPNINRLAAGGLRLTEFYNTARCSPSRASLLTGLHPHQAGMPHLSSRYKELGTTKYIVQNAVTIPEVLKENGYSTYMVGKWHLSSEGGPEHFSKPLGRGFEKAYWAPAGAGNYFKPDAIYMNIAPVNTKQLGPDYYFTDDITDKALAFLGDHIKENPEKPFFMYVAHSAPHFPLQAKEEDIKKYKGRFDKGWDGMRMERYERMKEMGIIDPLWELSPRDEFLVPTWEDEPRKDWRLRAMEVYAAQVDCMDQNIGKLLDFLEKTDQLDNTVVIFLSDNGATGEINDIGNKPMPGGINAKGAYGAGWAQLSNTPFKLYKHYIHEGGIAAPFIIHWPAGIKENGIIRRSPAQLTDVMSTVVDLTGSTYPDTYNGNEIIPMEGTSMLSIFRDDTSSKEYLFWEHEGNSGVRYKNWKLVKLFRRDWELYDMKNDGTEMHDVAKQYPEVVKQLSDQYEIWTKRANVEPYDKFYEYDEKHGKAVQLR